MSDIPMFSARGNTDAERISEMMSYLSNLSSAIDRELLSIDFSNLNSDLADRINKGITEHQDLTGFSSKNYTKGKIEEAKSYAATQAYNAQENAKSYAETQASHAESNAKSYAESYADSLIEALTKTIEEIQEKAEEAYRQACTTSGWLEADTLLDRVKALEDKVG